MNALQHLISILVEQVVEEDELEEMSGSGAAAGYVLPLGAKPQIIDPEKPKAGRKNK